MRSKSFLRMHIKVASLGVALDRGVKLARLEGLEPRAKPSQLAWGELFDGFLDFFGSGHKSYITFARGGVKGWWAQSRTDWHGLSTDYAFR